MNVFDILREKLKEIVYHDKHRKTVYLEGVYEIIYQAEQELGNPIICSLGSPCEYQNEDIRVNDNNGWIPCSERLPQVETEVLVCAKQKLRNGTYTYIITTAMYEDGTVLENDSVWRWEEIEGEWDEENDCYIIPEGWWENNHYNPDGVLNYAVDDEVLAWKPLPEPYRG